MIGSIQKLGIGGGLGFIAGLAAVVWIAPTTTAGTILVVAVCVVVGTVIWGGLSLLAESRKGAQVASSTTARDSPSEPASSNLHEPERSAAPKPQNSAAERNTADPALPSDTN